MLKAFFKSSMYILSLTVISVIGAFIINSALAWVAPASDPPTGNISIPWSRSGTNVGLTTATDYVGIGISSPNKQLHLKTASGNAEIDIQSAAQNYWALYHDNTTEQIRFWNADFTGNLNGNGVGNAFIIDNDGTVLVKTPADGDSDNAAATKGYVDAAMPGEIASIKIVKDASAATGDSVTADCGSGWALSRGGSNANNTSLSDAKQTAMQNFSNGGSFGTLADNGFDIFGTQSVTVATAAGTYAAIIVECYKE